jgi:hypothetical protein
MKVAELLDSWNPDLESQFKHDAIQKIRNRFKQKQLSYHIALKQLSNFMSKIEAENILNDIHDHQTESPIAGNG